MELDSTQAVPQPTMHATLAADQCEVLLIRHGRSADVVPGSAESHDPPLHTVGHEQADKLTRRLAGKQLAAIYSSHLARARQTAAPLASARSIAVEVHDDLEEIRLRVHRTMIFTVENTSITAVRVGPGGPTLITVNDCNHLYDPVAPS